MDSSWQEPGYCVYSDWLKQHYGEKVYKIPVNIPVSCPNRDGTIGLGGCIYCGKTGGGQENLPCTISIKAQILQTRTLIEKRYKARKFIPFFQSFSNTYLPFNEFKAAVEEAIQGENIVGLAIATRPDCIFDEFLDYLQQIQAKNKIDVTIELGLQTSNDTTLKIINRGHTLGDYIQSAIKVKQFGLSLCTHVILDLPWDGHQDVVTTAQVISAVGTDFVKCHALYVEPHTILANMLACGDIVLFDQNEYIERCILFLKHINPYVIIQRIIGRSPAKDSIVTNWNSSWWKVRDCLHERLAEKKITQGMLYGENYKAIRNQLEI